MARKIIIGEILNLIKGLGGNPNKFMGTRSNINFLGKGPQENLFQSAIDIEGMVKSGFPIQKVISEAESAGGYVTAGKLNDLQLQRLKDNLISLKKAYFPEQIANITDLGTGTGGLTQEGLGSLRTKQLFGELPEGVEASETILPTGGLMGRISERMKNIQKMSDELGAVGKEEKGVTSMLQKLSDDMGRGSKAGTEPLWKQQGYTNVREMHETEAAMGNPISKKWLREAKIKEALEGDPTKEMTYTVIDPTAEKVSYASRFNPKNEVHVNKAKALLEDPQLKGVYTEAVGSITV